MTNDEILKAYLWHIRLYAHLSSEQDIHDELVDKARKFIGLDIRMIREGLEHEDVLMLILFDINGQINRCDWYAADKNFRLFDQIAFNKRVLGSLLFDRWYKASEAYHRRGLLDKAISCTIQAEKYATGHEMKYIILMQRGEIESSMKIVMSSLSIHCLRHFMKQNNWVTSMLLVSMTNWHTCALLDMPPLECTICVRLRSLQSVLEMIRLPWRIRWQG